MRVVGLRLLAPLFWIAAATAQILSFQHVIVIVQENRTPDNLFHGLCVAPTPHSCSTTPTNEQYNIQMKNWLDNLAESRSRHPLG